MKLEHVFGLAGRTALVTGASRGIGAAIAEGLAGAGATVIVHATTLTRTEPTCARITDAGGRALAVAGDLAQPAAGTRLIADAVAVAGQIDILVINASAQVNALLEALTEADLEMQLSVNLRATIGMLQAALPPMAARGWGRVVNIGSINQSRPKSVVTAYAATKAAQHNLIQSQARDYARHGVMLNTLSPGLIDTDRNAHRRAADPQAWQDYAKSLNWVERAGFPAEMVGAAILLSSNACSFMAGEVITLSGGQ